MGGVFFISWPLWQEMTFVLGCSIVLVFCLGLGKLWWANRKMQRLEVMDAEKRARTSDIHKCGITTLRGDEIPFGIRAIQQGIQVDGIWISSPPDAHALSQVESSTTTYSNHPDIKSHGRRELEVHADVHPEVKEQRAHPGQGYTPYTENGVSRDQRPTFQASQRSGVELPLSSRFDTVGAQKTCHNPSRPHVESYIPSGIRKQASTDTQSRPPTSHSETVPFIENIGYPRSSVKGIVQYGSAQIHANRGSRRPNRDFEVLPAGTHGPRRELEDITNSGYVEVNHKQNARPQSSRLPKRAPVV